MKIIDYNPEDKIVPLHIDDLVVVCHTEYEDYGTLSIVNHSDEVGYYLRGLEINKKDLKPFYENVHPRRWLDEYNIGSMDILRLMIRKFCYQNHANHTWYIIENLKDLEWIVDKFNLSYNKEFYQTLMDTFEVFGGNNGNH